MVRDLHSQHPIHGAVIKVEGRNKDVSTSATGEFWRLLLRGVYTVEASAKGYISKRKRVNVLEDRENLVFFYLERQNDQHEIVL